MISDNLVLLYKKDKIVHNLYTTTQDDISVCYRQALKYKFQQKVKESHMNLSHFVNDTCIA